MFESFNWTTFVEGAAAGITLDRLLRFGVTAAVAALIVAVEKLKDDGVDDWKDRVSARLLKILSKSDYNALKEGLK